MLNDILLGRIISYTMTLPAFLGCVGASMLLGVLAALLFTAKTHHTDSFTLTVAVLPAIVCLVIMLVNGNIGTGLGVAGTFALTRFRSLPGTAREIAALFFAVALGIACGMGYVVVAGIFFVMMAAFVLVLEALHFGGANNAARQLKITIPEDLDYEGLFDDLFDRYTTRRELMRVRTTNMGTLYELSYRIQLKNPAETKAFIDEIRCRNGNLNIVCGRVSDGEMM